jgi:rod shape-determining protein MreD
MNLLGRFRLVLLVLLILTIQRTILDGVVVHHAHPDAMVLIPIVIAYLYGPEKGAVAGFVVGLLSDLFLATPFGLTALTLTATSYYVGVIKSSTRASSWWLPGLVAAAASSVQVVFFALLGAILGQPAMLQDNLAAIVIVVAVANGLLAAPVLRAVSWATASSGASARSRRALGSSDAGSGGRSAAITRSAATTRSSWRSN